jgi:hypothetical protein
METGTINWNVSVDKLRVCLNMPEGLFDYLKEHYTHINEDCRILNEDDFSLVFFEEDEKNMSSVLNVRDIDGYFRLGKFDFNNTNKYENKAFFTFENDALYRIFSRNCDSTPNNYICCLMFVVNYYGMEFNNVTEIELALDCKFDYISKLRRMIKNVERYDLFINRKEVKDGETLDGYGEFYSRNRKKMAKLPTLYFSQAKDTDMKMRIYDKARELKENSPYKEAYLKDWHGWDNLDNTYRVEVVLHNSNVRSAVAKLGKECYEEWGEHSNLLYLLNDFKFRLMLFANSTDGLIYFKDKRNDKKISLIDLLSGI